MASREPPFSAPKLSRRQIIGSGVALGAGGVALSVGGAFGAQSSAASLDDFMRFSAMVTGRGNLDRGIGERLMAALNVNTPTALQNLPALISAFGAGASTLSPDQQAQALAIQQAWYLGMIGKTVVTYEKALMFGAVEGYLRPRSFCGGPPGFWAQPPQGSPALAATAGPASGSATSTGPIPADALSRSQLSDGQAPAGNASAAAGNAQPVTDRASGR